MKHTQLLVAHTLESSGPGCTLCGNLEGRIFHRRVRERPEPLVPRRTATVDSTLMPRVGQEWSRGVSQCGIPVIEMSHLSNVNRGWPETVCVDPGSSKMLFQHLVTKYRSLQTSY